MTDIDHATRPNVERLLAATAQVPNFEATTRHLCNHILHLEGVIAKLNAAMDRVTDNSLEREDRALRESYQLKLVLCEAEIFIDRVMELAGCGGLETPETARRLWEMGVTARTNIRKMLNEGLTQKNEADKKED